MTTPRQVAQQQVPARLRVAVAAPLSEGNCARIQELEPRIDLVIDQSLLPPMRWPADFAGDPSWRRTPEQQRAYEAAVDSADALYGIPDVDPAALARTIRANPRLRWVHTMAAAAAARSGPPGSARTNSTGCCSPPRRECTDSRSRSSPCSESWPAPRVCLG